jgi:hypothetical protein
LDEESEIKFEQRRFQLNSELQLDAGAAELALKRIEDLSPSTAAVVRARAILGGRLVDSTPLETVDAALTRLDAQWDAVQHDRIGLSLYIRLWWRRHTGRDFFASDRLCVRLAEPQWRRLEELMTLRLDVPGDQESPTALFHRAWARLQLGKVSMALRDLDALNRLGVGIGRRVRSLVVLSNQDGTPQKHQGEVRRVARANRAYAFLPALALEVAFNPMEFHLAAVQRYQPVGPLHVVLNYRGVYAENPSRFPTPVRTA